MTTYHQEKIQTAVAKIAECVGQKTEYWGHLQDIIKWSAEAEREAYARGKVAGLEEAERACEALPYENYALTEAISAIRALIPEN